MSFHEDAMKYGPATAAILECWQNLCDKDDRNSPADYPDHCLITYDELAGYMRQMREVPIEVNDELVGRALRGFDCGTGDPNDYRRRMRLALEAALHHQT